LFKLTSATLPAHQSITLQLFAKGGKVPILKKGQPVILLADKAGLVQMSNLPGRRYQIEVLIDGQPMMTNGLKLKVKPLLKQSDLVFYNRRRLARKKIDLTEENGLTTVHLP
ncbi:MAG: hypothetical protein LBS33_08760, partial [Streptococcaceae bacterium]|nr:hypothetical protein [Streptococcaceae bacterium]